MTTTFRLRVSEYVTGAKVIISRGVSSDPSNDFGLDTPNQLSKWTGAKRKIAFAHGSPIIRGILKIDWVNKVEADNLRTFIAEVLTFIKPFEIVTSDINVNLGNGNNILRLCYLEDGIISTDQLIYPAGKGHKYNVTIPFVCLDRVNLLEGYFN